VRTPARQPAATVAVIALVAPPLAYAAALRPYLALAGMAAAGIMALVLLRADLLLLILVAALPWEDSLAPPSAPIPVVKLLGLLLIAAWALRAAAGREPLRLPAVLVTVAAFTYAVGVSFLVSPDQSVSLVKTTSYVLFALFFFVIVQLVRDHADVRRVLIVVSLSAAASGARGLFEFLVLGTERAAGPISDPNGFAYVLASVLPLGGYLVATERRLRWLWVVCFALIAAAVAASLSRGALVGLAVVVLWALLTGRIAARKALLGSAVLITVAVGVFILVSPVIGDRVERKQSYGSKNVSSRQAFYRGALAMAADRPLAGIGPARFGTEAEQYVKGNPVALENPVVHNSYLEILAESGIFALASFFAFLAATWRLLAHGRRRSLSAGDRDGSRLASALQSTLLVAVVSGMFISAQLTTPFWLLGGLAAIFAGVAERPARLTSRGRPPLPNATLTSTPA